MHQAKQKLYIRIASFAVVLLMLLSGIPAAQAASGTCGDGVNWELAGGVLTISGSGPMEDYKDSASVPWMQYADSVYSVSVQKGVTRIGRYAFFGMEQVTAVSLASTVETVGDYAFQGCTSLSLLDLSYGVQALGEGAFAWCENLLAVRLPSTLTHIGYQAFYRCASLQTVTVPASVTNLEPTVFGHCTGLRSAYVLASIAQLPSWTFYGCENLSHVTLNPSITKTGVEAFERSGVIQEPEYSGLEKDTVEHSSASTDEQGVTTQQQFISTPNSTVTTQTTGTQSTVDAVVEKEQGWEEALQQANKATGETVHVNIHLKGEPEVSGEQLGGFAGKDMTVTIHTQQGAKWHINAAELDKQDLQKQYQLSFTLLPLTQPTDAQRAAVGIGDAFVVLFHTPLDFKVEVELPLGKEFAGSNAVFFAPEEKVYTSKQEVRIDDAGTAHFYLGQVAKDTEYLIGIRANVPVSGELDEAIIPDNMKDRYENLEQVEKIEYVVTGTKSTWGLNINQVTWILVAVMAGSVIVVGVVIGIMYKKKLKNGYIPGSDFDEKE